MYEGAVTDLEMVVTGILNLEHVAVIINIIV